MSGQPSITQRRADDGNSTMEETLENGPQQAPVAAPLSVPARITDFDENGGRSRVATPTQTHSPAAHAHSSSPSAAYPLPDIPSSSTNHRTDDAPKPQSGWDDMFASLVEFKKAHGHTRVPNRYAANKPLGNWVSTQRREYRKLMSGGGGTTPMTPERVRMLNSVGFVWTGRDPPDVPWNRKFRELIKYKQMYGDCLVPIGFKENVKLANWVSRQRQEYKRLMDGKKSRLTTEQIRKLDDAGFVWVAQRGGPERKLVPRNIGPASSADATVHSSSSAPLPSAAPPPAASGMPPASSAANSAPMVPKVALVGHDRGGGPSAPDVTTSAPPQQLTGSLPNATTTSTALQTQASARGENFAEFLKMIAGRVAMGHDGGGGGSSLRGSGNSAVSRDLQRGSTAAGFSGQGGTAEGTQIVRAPSKALQALQELHLKNGAAAQVDGTSLFSVSTQNSGASASGVQLSDINPDVLRLYNLLSGGAVIKAVGGSMFSVTPLAVAAAGSMQRNDVSQTANQIEGVGYDVSKDNEAKEDSSVVQSAAMPMEQEQDALSESNPEASVSELDPEILQLCILLSKGAVIQAKNGEISVDVTPLTGVTKGTSYQRIEPRAQEMKQSSVYIEELGDDAGSADRAAKERLAEVDQGMAMLDDPKYAVDQPLAYGDKKLSPDRDDIARLSLSSLGSLSLSSLGNLAEVSIDNLSPMDHVSPMDHDAVPVDGLLKASLSDIEDEELEDPDFQEMFQMVADGL